MDCCSRDSVSGQLLMGVQLSATISQERPRAIDHVAVVPGALPRGPVVASAATVRVFAPFEPAEPSPAMIISSIWLTVNKCGLLFPR